MMAPDVAREATMSIAEGEQRPFMNGSVISDKYYTLNPVRTTETGQPSADTAQVTSPPPPNQNLLKA
jgi:hypothetical protein